MKKYTVIFNYIDSLEIEADDAASGYHQGQCDNDILALMDKPYINDQLSQIDPDKLAKELAEYGWTFNELSDHDANKMRILWLACGDIDDNGPNVEEV